MKSSSEFYTQTKHLNTITRVFEADQLEDEITWHRDHCDRTVTVTEGSGWQLQFDNQLPVQLDEGTQIRIPANVYHRIWPGKDQLIVQITEHQQGE